MPTLSKVPDTMTDTNVTKSKEEGVAEHAVKEKKEDNSDEDSDIDIEGMLK